MAENTKNGIPAEIMLNPRDRCYTANQRLYLALNPNATQYDFGLHWVEAWGNVDNHNLSVYKQLNYSGSSMRHLLELLVQFTRLVINREDAEVLYNWCEEYFTEEYLLTVGDQPDRVRLVLRNQLDEGRTLFGLGLHYDSRYGIAKKDTEQYLAKSLIAELAAAIQELQFCTTDMRTRIISILLDLVEEPKVVKYLLGDETTNDIPVYLDKRADLGYVCRDMTCRSVDDNVPGVDLGSDRGVDLDWDAGGNLPRYGFGLMAVPKTQASDL